MNEEELELALLCCIADADTEEEETIFMAFHEEYEQFIDGHSLSRVNTLK